MRARAILLAIGLSAVFSAGAAEREKLAIGDRETIVFYGDSITEQNLYSAYLETFLITRFPQKDLAIYNFGWSGDTAKGGAGRFLRDAGRVKPSLVFVNFGMNDGSYTLYEDWIGESYIAAQRRLAGIVRKSGARLVWFTQSPVDCHGKNVSGWCPGYNGTLERMAGMLKSLGAESGVQVIDLFSPVLAVSEAAKKNAPGSTFIPDSIHPDETGHMVMAYYALKGMAVEGGGGVLSLGSSHAAVDGRMAAANLRRAEGRIEFDLRLPFIPFYVPREARRALSLVPFQAEFNRFVLRVPEWDPAADCEIYVDGLKAAVVPGRRLVEGLDLAALDSAPWSVQARRVWEISEVRWKKHFEAWREMELGDPSAWKESPKLGGLIRSQEEYVADLGRIMRRTARPRVYRVILAGKKSGGFPQLLEGWDELWSRPWNNWDGSVAIAPVREPVTQGTGALRLDFDFASYDWPLIFARFDPPEEIYGAKGVSVDVWVPRGLVGSGTKLLLGIKLDAFECWRPDALVPGGWNRMVFRFDEPCWSKDKGPKSTLDPEEAGQIRKCTFVLGAEGGKPRGRVIFDNFLLVK